MEISTDCGGGVGTTVHLVIFFKPFFQDFVILNL